MSAPNSGPGLCLPTHQLSIRPVQAVIELGAIADVLHSALNAVHHANRSGTPNNRIAVALPTMHVHRGIARPGTEIVVFGSQAALERYLALEGTQRLARRGMVKDLNVMEAIGQPGERGTAYLRDRQVARRSPGAVRRAKARAERRGVTMSDKMVSRPTSHAVLALHFGSAVVHVRAIEAEISAGPLLIGTYGFSAVGNPAVLPILADNSKFSLEDAA